MLLADLAEQFSTDIDCVVQTRLPTVAINRVFSIVEHLRMVRCSTVSRPRSGPSRRGGIGPKVALLILLVGIGILLFLVNIALTAGLVDVVVP